MHPESVLSLFVGAWSLLNISSTQNGIPNVDPGFGPHPVGLILYHLDQYMSAALASTTPEDRPQNLTWPYRPAQGDADWALVGKHSIAYMGPFRLNESVPVVETEGGVEGQVVHGPLEVASLPSFMGTYQRRDFSLLFHEGGRRGGEGTLLNLKADLGGGARMSLWWEKI
ncbi:Lipocalin-like domain-containing protein [Macrophomina phaseolina]|uniref:Lipocalin-like domain-containing protein n=1 Tax=Macrophomina phaseolina TaxID=35725 RepID=A0ABQ8FUM4_9PEZI|nr:Lipocalin-like domain-containing protein [Macrophomina phaseolina]